MEVWYQVIGYEDNESLRVWSNGNNKFLQNIGTYLSDYMALHLRKS
jgi:hypothetical protein